MLHSEQIDQYIRPMSPIRTPLPPAGKLIHGVRAILFDIYGTLFISGSGDIGISGRQHVQKQQLNRLLQKYRINRSSDDIQADLFSAVEAAHRQAKQRGIDYPEVIIDEIWKQVPGIRNLSDIQMFAVEYELIVNPVYPMPGLRQVLDQLKKRPDLVMGLISNAQFYTPLLFQWCLNSDLDALGFDTDLIVFSWQTERAKPSPFLFDIVSDTLRSKDIPPESVLYVGNDMLNDILPAKQAGFQAGLFAGDARSLRLREDDPRCASIRPDLIITDLIQLPVILNATGASCS